MGADKEICEHIGIGAAVLPEVKDRVQMVRDVLRSLGQPKTETSPA